MTLDPSQERHSIYFEFDDFTSSTPACPIVQYKVIDIVVRYPLHQTDSLNYKYGRRQVPEGGVKYVYEASEATADYGVIPSICPRPDDPTNTANKDGGHWGNPSRCTDRMQPTNVNNTVAFSNYSPFDPAQYADQRASTKVRDGDYVHHNAEDTQKAFRKDSYILHVKDCLTPENELGYCERPRCTGCCGVGADPWDHCYVSGAAQAEGACDCGLEQPGT